MKTTDHSLDAEEAVIAAVLMSAGAFDEVASVINADDFYSESNRILWQTFTELSDKGVPQDVTTVVDHLRRKDLLKKVGGASEVSRLTDSLADVANAAWYAGIVRDMATSRRMAKMLREVAQCNDPNDAIDQAQTALDSIAAKQIGATSAPISEAAQRVRERAKSLAERRTKVLGVKTGFSGLDDIIVTLAPKQLYILAARPSLGKTALACNIVTDVTVRQKGAVLFVSLEMGQDELTERIMAQMMGIDTQRFMKGTFDLAGVPNDLEKIDDAVGILSDAKLYIDDRSVLTTTELRTLARKVQSTQGLDLIVVDYLQLMVGPGSTPNEVYGNISRTLKGIAKDLNVAVLALCQMSRLAEHEDRMERPRLSDLRDSGRIEQDADKVIFLVRDRDNTPGIAQAQIAKNRQGPSGDVPLRFNQDFGSFVDGSWEDFVE